MSIFKKLKSRLFRKKSGERKSAGADVKKVNVLLEMPHNIFSPADLMEPLLMAIAMETRKPAAASVTGIRLYSLYDRKDNSFLGSFYALKFEGRIYGNIVGSPQIFSCTKETFRFKETDELIVPLKDKRGQILVLVCKYKRSKNSLTAVCLKEMDKFMQNEKILREFADRTSVDEAYHIYKKMEKTE